MESLLTIEKSPEVDVIIDFVKALRPKETLEVGCNFGRELKYLEGLTQLYGIDNNIKKVEAAQEYVQGTFVHADAASIPFNDENFDLVYGTGVFCHNPPEYIKYYIEEMFRVSRKYILIVEYIGSHLSRTTVGNCKQHTWVHDYELLAAKLNVIIKYNRKVFFGTDCFQVLLLEKVLPAHVTQNIIPQNSRFILKLGKYKLEIK